MGPSPSSDTSSPLPSPPIPVITTTSADELPQRTVAFLGQIQDGRRPSIQFAPHSLAASVRTGSPKIRRPKLQQRFSSPPPPSTYKKGVSFDTFDNRDATDFSFTLRYTHRHYTYTKRSRTFLCGTDLNDYSDYALDWLIEELVDDGDEVVCLRVIDKDSKINSESSLEEGRYRTEACKLMEHIKAKNQNDEKSISLILEFAVGKIHETIQRHIVMYEPACLIVGTRGRSLGGIQGLLPGSVSKYCLQNSPVPVIVVRPSKKREKKKEKRRADPNRHSYVEIIEASGARSSILDTAQANDLAGLAGLEAPAEEATAVAKAIGLATTSPAYVKFRRESNEDVDKDAVMKKVLSTDTITPEYSSRYTEVDEGPSPSNSAKGLASSESEDDSDVSQGRDLFGSHKPTRVSRSPFGSADRGKIDGS